MSCRLLGAFVFLTIAFCFEPNFVAGVRSARGSYRSSRSYRYRSGRVGTSASGFVYVPLVHGHYRGQNKCNVTDPDDPTYTRIEDCPANTGAIVAGILIPIIAIIVVTAIICCVMKKKRRNCHPSQPCRFSGCKKTTEKKPVVDDPAPASTNPDFAYPTPAPPYVATPATGAAPPPDSAMYPPPASTYPSPPPAYGWGVETAPPPGSAPPSYEDVKF